MIIYTDNTGRVMNIGNTDRMDLNLVELDETAPDYPFREWSSLRICCYRVAAQDGHVTAISPYVPTHILAAIELVDSKVVSAEQMITELDLQSITAKQAITNMDLRLLEVGA